MKHYVYVHYRRDDNSIFYVGKGQGGRATRKHGRNSYWKATAEKHGLLVEIVSYFDTKDEAFLYESILIALLKESGEKLCNLAPGGEGGSSPEQLKKLHISNIGSKRSAESKAKLSKSLTGIVRKSGKECCHCKYKTIATDIETGEEIVMIGTKEIIANGFKQGSVARCLVGQRTKHKGHTFRQEPILDEE